MDRNAYDIDWRTHGNRYYDPEVGRYLTRDPIGYGDGMNVYVYVKSNPINKIDPLGLNELTEEQQAWVDRMKAIAEGRVTPQGDPGVMAVKPGPQAQASDESGIVKIDREGSQQGISLGDSMGKGEHTLLQTNPENSYGYELVVKWRGPGVNAKLEVDFLEGLKVGAGADAGQVELVNRVRSPFLNVEVTTGVKGPGAGCTAEVGRGGGKASIGTGAGGGVTGVELSAGEDVKAAMEAARQLPSIVKEGMEGLVESRRGAPGATAGSWRRMLDAD